MKVARLARPASLRVGRSFGRRAAIVTAMTLIGVASVGLFAKVVFDWGAADVSAYWNAALRLQSGQPLYQAGLPTDTELYRYAPWFAYAWVPLTHLPRQLVEAGWTVILLAASFASTLPLLRHGGPGIALCALLLPIQLDGAAYGNVQPLLVLVLMWGVTRASAPIWIALAASLKAVPILLVLVLLGRRQYWQALATGLLFGVLVAPMVLFDLSGYNTDSGPMQLSLAQVSLPLWAAVALLAAFATWFWARTRFGWFFGSVALVAGLPRLLSYELGFLMIATAGLRDDASEPRAPRRIQW
jgi:hypothetical protein